jgi:uncharacterized protein (DUF1015 family)
MKVFPINTLLPKQEVISDIVSLGSGKLPEHLLIEKAQKSDLSYLRIVKPQFINPNLVAGTEEFYNSSVQYFDSLKSSGNLTEINNSIFYYQQTHHSGANLGGWIIGVDGDDYLNGKVKRHENTIRAKEDRLVKHIQVLNSMAEPVLLSQVLPNQLNELARVVIQTPPELSLTDEMSNLHQVWVIQDKSLQSSVLSEFQNIDSLYIADGHHRVAGSSRFLVDQFGHNSGKGFMALIMNEDDLLIKPFYRIVKTELEHEQFQSFLENQGIECTKLELNDQSDYKSVPFRSVCCFCNRQAFIFKLPESNSSKAVDQLDVAITENLIFGPAFNITNTAHDVNIRFQRGDMSIRQMMKYLKEDEIGFLFHSNTMAEIRAVADEGSIMPPKSTFIEPKLLTGLIVETYI